MFLTISLCFSESNIKNRFVNNISISCDGIVQNDGWECVVDARTCVENGKLQSFSSGDRIQTEC